MAKIRKLFIVDDMHPELNISLLEKIFGDIEICPFRSVREAIEHLDQTNLYPDAILLDTCYTGWRLNEEWGLENAKTIHQWFQKNAPGTMPAFLLQSADTNIAERSAKSFLSETGLEAFAMDKSEIALALDLIDGNKPDRDIDSNGFRRFVNKALGLNLPVTPAELDNHMVEKQLWTPEDLIDFVEDEKMSRDEALIHLADQAKRKIEFACDEVRHPDKNLSGFFNSRCFFHRGSGSPAKGVAAFNLDEVKRHAAKNQKSVLFIEQYTTDFIPDLKNMAGIVMLGSEASGHMSIVLGAHNVSAVCGLDTAMEYTISEIENGTKHQILLKKEDDSDDKKKARTVKTGDIVTLDPQNNHFYNMDLGFQEADLSYRNWLPKTSDFLKEWHADHGINPIRIKANLDNTRLINEAQWHGDGIGLVRTEHLVLSQKEHLDSFKKAVFSGGRDIADFRKYQEEEFDHFFYALNPDFPIRVRLIDAPPSEFFFPAELNQLETMYGDSSIRGAQLAMNIPQIYEAQINAIFSILSKERGPDWDGQPKQGPFAPIEIMVPTVRNAVELITIKNMVEKVATERGLTKSDYRFGSMLETLDACQNIEDIVKECDFLSIGSNDLTSEILNCGRDDWKRRHDLTIARGTNTDPFISIHSQVVEQLEKTLQRARAVKPGIGIDLCGAHASDMASLNKMKDLGLHSISVPPTDKNLIGLRILYNYQKFEDAQGGKPVLGLTKNTPDHSPP